MVIWELLINVFGGFIEDGLQSMFAKLLCKMKKNKQSDVFFNEICELGYKDIIDDKGNKIADNKGIVNLISRFYNVFIPAWLNRQKEYVLQSSEVVDGIEPRYYNIQLEGNEYQLKGYHTVFLYNILKHESKDKGVEIDKYCSRNCGQYFSDAQFAEIEENNFKSWLKIADKNNTLYINNLISSAKIKRLQDPNCSLEEINIALNKLDSCLKTVESKKDSINECDKKVINETLEESLEKILTGKFEYVSETLGEISRKLESLENTINKKKDEIIDTVNTRERELERELKTHISEEFAKQNEQIATSRDSQNTIKILQHNNIYKEQDSIKGKLYIQRLNEDGDAEKIQNYYNNGAKIVIIKSTESIIRGGIGKTTLAEHYLSKLQDNEYLQTINFTNNNASTTNIKEFIREIILDGEGQPNDKEGNLQRALSNTSGLIFIDDIDCIDIEFVKYIYSICGNCKFLITARSYNGGDSPSVKVIELPNFNQKDAEKLFCYHLGIEGRGLSQTISNAILNICEKLSYNAKLIQIIAHEIKERVSGCNDLEHFIENEFNEFIKYTVLDDYQSIAEFLINYLKLRQLIEYDDNAKEQEKSLKEKIKKCFYIMQRAKTNYLPIEGLNEFLDDTVGRNVCRILEEKGLINVQGNVFNTHEIVSLAISLLYDIKDGEKCEVLKNEDRNQAELFVGLQTGIYDDNFSMENDDELIIPNGVRNIVSWPIGWHCFNMFDKGKNVLSIPKSVKQISAVFSPKVEQITYNGNLNDWLQIRINFESFILVGCKRLVVNGQDISKIEVNVNKLESYSLTWYSGLKNIRIGEKVERISKRALSRCSQLERIEVDLGNLYYESKDGVLYNKGVTLLRQYPCGKKCSDFKIPNTVIRIGAYAFEWCPLTQDLIIPATVKYISISAFKESCFKNIIIEDGLQTIDYGAFQWSNVEKIDLPHTLTTIGDYAFNTNSLEHIKYRGTMSEWRQIDGHENVKQEIVCLDGTISGEKKEKLKWVKF